MHELISTWLIFVFPPPLGPQPLACTHLESMPPTLSPCLSNIATHHPLASMGFATVNFCQSMADINDSERRTNEAMWTQAGRKRSVSSLSLTFATDWTIRAFPLANTGALLIECSTIIYSFTLTTLLPEDLFLSGPASSNWLIVKAALSAEWIEKVSNSLSTPTLLHWVESWHHSMTPSTGLPFHHYQYLSLNLSCCHQPWCRLLGVILKRSLCMVHWYLTPGAMPVSFSISLCFPTPWHLTQDHLFQWPEFVALC